MILECGALRDLVAFVQFKKREKHPWRSVNASHISAHVHIQNFNSWVVGDGK